FSRRTLWMAAAIATAAVLVIGVNAARHRRPQPKVPVSGQQQALVPVRITTNPADADVAIDGKLLGSRTVPLRPDQHYSVTVSRLGYQPVITHQPGSLRNWNFVLRPLPLHIRVFTAELHGNLLLDAQPAGSLQNGDLPDYEFVR